MGQVKWMMMVRGGMLHEIDLILLVLQVVRWNQMEKRWMASIGEWLYHLWRNTVVVTINA